MANAQIESRIVVISPKFHAPGPTVTAPKYDDLPIATAVQSQEFMDMGRQFVDANNTYHYTHARGVAATAIADYIASTHGVQLLRVAQAGLTGQVCHKARLV